MSLKSTPIKTAQHFALQACQEIFLNRGQTVELEDLLVSGGGLSFQLLSLRKNTTQATKPVATGKSQTFQIEFLILTLKLGGKLFSLTLAQTRKENKFCRDLTCWDTGSTPTAVVLPGRYIYQSVPQKVRLNQPCPRRRYRLHT